MPPTVTVVGTGGTIASTAGEGGAAPTLSSADLLEAVPTLEEYADLTTREVAQSPGFDVDHDVVDRVARAVRDARGEDDGVVVTHGTDTVEESAYLLDLTLAADLPVVFTGAQRRPDELSADGPSNLETAVRAASHDRIRAAGGVYVAFDEALHAARDVTKAHTRKVGGFDSPGTGPVAEFTRVEVRFHRDPGSDAETAAAVSPAEAADATVPIVTSGLGMDAGALDRAVEAGADAVVLAGTGLGNATAAIGDAIGTAIDRGVPVVVTSRCPAGPTNPVYGTPGGGQTLRDHGAIFAGDLPAWKARLKLQVALAETRDLEPLRDRFATD